MKTAVSILGVLLTICPVLGTSARPIGSAAELFIATYEQSRIGEPFEFIATALSDSRPDGDPAFAVEDASGAMILRRTDSGERPFPVLKAGSALHVRGVIARIVRSGQPYASCRSVEILSEGQPPAPPTVTAAEMDGGRYDCRVIRLNGTVRDVLSDEIDPDCTFVVLDSGNRCAYVPCDGIRKIFPIPQIGARISVSGICSPSNLGNRHQIGRIIIVCDRTGFRVIETPTATPFDVPDISALVRRQPHDIALLGRHRARGHVLAVWNDSDVLIETPDRRLSRLRLAQGKPPNPGEFIEATGFPESDLYHINLVRVLWRPAASFPIAETPPQDVTAESLHVDDKGRKRFNAFAHGRVVRIRGIVRNLPGVGNDDGRFHIESGAFIVPIDVSSCPRATRDLTVGCDVEITGVCVMDTDNWRQNSVFPRIKGFSIVIRSPHEIVVRARPPWWTPARLIAVIGTLGFVLAFILFWNLLLRRAVDRRGRELETEITARIGSEFKVCERTRLAVELHDSLAQSLTGATLEVKTADKIADTDANGMHQHLSLAVKTLNSCREELRNCLWDLRNLTLEEATVDDAIRKTIAACSDGASVSVRFNVPRERLSDNTAHTILRIIRELVTNAVRHGAATAIKIAGSIEGDRLLFSVRDNGTGFDSATSPGMAQGHFGLQGIRDRIDVLEGDMSIDTAPGKGTKVTISINIRNPPDGQTA